MYKWLEYSPKVDRMYCFTCRIFALKAPGSVGQVDCAFTTTGRQARRWKETRSIARSILYKHQNKTLLLQLVFDWIELLLTI